MVAQSSRRTGGRSARRNASAASLSEHLRLVRGGMKGGTYQPLSSEGVHRIHCLLEVLENVGLADGGQTVALNSLQAHVRC